MTEKEFKAKLFRNLTSKKFQAMIGGVMLTLSVAIANSISWQQAQLSAIILIAGYLGVQGAIDFKTKK